MMYSSLIPKKIFQFSAQYTHFWINLRRRAVKLIIIGEEVLGLVIIMYSKGIFE